MEINATFRNQPDWIPIQGNEKLYDKLIKTNKNCLIKFDTGQICEFLSDWPLAIATHFKPIIKYSDKQKHIDLLEKLINKHQTKSTNSSTESGEMYNQGVVDGLNIAFKILNNIDDDYLDGIKNL